MAKVKTVHNTPPPSPAAPAASSPPLAVALITALAQLVMIAVFAVGIATVATWTLDGAGLRVTRTARQPAPPRGEWVHCWRDPRYGEMCEPAAPRPGWPRRNYMVSY
jgi:hypothetical protein